MKLEVLDWAIYFAVLGTKPSSRGWLFEINLFFGLLSSQFAFFLQNLNTQGGNGFQKKDLWQQYHFMNQAENGRSMRQNLYPLHSIYPHDHGEIINLIWNSFWQTLAGNEKYEKAANDWIQLTELLQPCIQCKVLFEHIYTRPPILKCTLYFYASKTI